MVEIIPRWEWRTFAIQIPPAEAAFASMTSESETNSEELYLLVPGGANVKIRDGLIDIKELQEVDIDGLERWLPIMKARFPLSRADAATVVSSLNAPHVVLERDAYTLDQLLDEVIEQIPESRVANVHKHRVRYIVEGCMAELTDVSVDGQPTRTIAVESEDKRAVVRAILCLGLAGYLNTNYPRGLGAVITQRPTRYAVIDIGTNSVKFNLGERTATGSWKTLTDRAEITRLGEDLGTNAAISSAATDRTAVAIAGMVEEAQAAGALAIVAVGTAGLRIADNRADVISTIKEQAGISVDVVSGAEESRLAYVAVQSSLGLGSETLVVFDTGGGSSQFTFGESTHVDERFSVKVGAVRYTEEFGLANSVSDVDLRAAMSSISADLSALDNRPGPDALVGMGGAVTNIAAVSLSMATYDPDVIQGMTLDRAEVDRQIEMYCSMDVEDRRTVVGLQANRAEVILAGALIVATIMDKLAQQSMTVSDRGLRHGLIVERFHARLVD